MTSLKRDQRMHLIDHMNDTLAEHRYNTDASHVTWQAPNPIELQTRLTYSLTIFIFPKPPQQMRRQLQNHN